MSLTLFIGRRSSLGIVAPSSGLAKDVFGERPGLSLSLAVQRSIIIQALIERISKILGLGVMVATPTPEDSFISHQNQVDKKIHVHIM